MNFLIIDEFCYALNMELIKKDQYYWKPLNKHEESPCLLIHGFFRSRLDFFQRRGNIIHAYPVVDLNSLVLFKEKDLEIFCEKPCIINWVVAVPFR